MWQGPICPKIRKKIAKNTEWANTCYALPTGKGIFQVRSMDTQYIVDIVQKQCDCRRWDLTGIPCSHAISCMRHERISPESVVHECYSSARYPIIYGPKIWPCNDQSQWTKVIETEVLPPVYEKKVGRPAKNRRKQPHEVEGKNGPKMSKHGTIITCSYCGGKGHNKGGCNLKKAGLRPKLLVQRGPNVQLEESIEKTQASGDPNVSQVLNTSLCLMEHDETEVWLF